MQINLPVTWVAVGALLCIATAGRAQSEPAPASEGEKLVADLQKEEVIVSSLKFQGLLKEKADGTVTFGPNAAANKEQANLAKSHEEKVNGLRSAYSKEIKDVEPAKVLERYAVKIAARDGKKFEEATGEVLVRVVASTSLAQFLAPQLASAFLVSGKKASHITHAWNGSAERIYGYVDSKPACIELVVSPATAIFDKISDQKTLALAHVSRKRPVPSAMHRELVATDAVGVIINPLVSLKKADSAVVTYSVETGKFAGSIFTSLKFCGMADDDEMLDFLPGKVAISANETSYDLIEQHVFSDKTAIALVPLPICNTTDNKLLRVGQGTNESYRPTPLTVDDRKYPCIREVIAVFDKAAPGLTDFVRFLSTPEGRKAILEAGFAPSKHSTGN